MDRKTRGRERQRQAREGMTLIEIMVVVVLMSLIATAVAVGVLGVFETGKEKLALHDVATIRGSVLGYWLNGGEGCPTAPQLIALGALDETASPLDPWRNEYRVECRGTSVVVTSAGPDRQLGTQDDISTAQRRLE